MAAILHLRKELVQPPVAPAVAGICVRTMVVPDDIPAWLALRDRAMANQLPRARPWTDQDFADQMLGKPWWRNDWTWLAFDKETDKRAVGAVTLAVREGAAKSAPIIHWLVVDPHWRRRGLGRLLVSKLEQAAWEQGWREIRLETHSGWTGAIGFYQSSGYAPAPDREPR